MSLKEFEKIFRRRFWERTYHFQNFFRNFL